MQNELQVVVAGHISFDVIPAFKKNDKVKMEEIFVPGKLLNMGSVKVSTGGPVSNTGIALSILGINTNVMGKIGNDYFGEGVLKLLKERNAYDGMIAVDGEETSYTVVIVPPGFDRIFLHNPGANNTFGEEDINYNLVKQAKLFHFGYPPLMQRIFENDGEELVNIFRKVKKLGVTTSLDMSLPDASSESGKVNWERLLMRLLPYVDIYIPSVEETMFMIQRKDFDELKALEISEAVNSKVCCELIKRIDTSSFESKDILIVLLNPSSSVRREIVKVYIDIPQEYNVWDFEILDGDNLRMEKQLVSRKEEVVPVHELNSRPWPFYADRFCFYMDTGEMPCCGYKVFKVVPGHYFNRKTVFWAEMRTSNGDCISKALDTMENEYLKVKVESNGTVSMVDKASGRLYRSLNYFEDTGDCGDYWVYYPPYHNRVYSSKGCPVRMWQEDNGALSATIGVEIKMRVPAFALRSENAIKGESRRSDEERELTFTCRYTLKKGSKRVDVSLKVDNTAEDHRLRLMFDTGIKAEFSDAAGHFTVDRRPVCPPKDKNGTFYPEMQTLPMQSFVDLSDGRHGFAVLNNCFSEFEAMNNDEGTLSITLFRSVRNIICSEFRSAGAFPHENGGQSLGIQEYAYSLYPHEGDWSQAEAYVEAERLNLPPKIVQTSRNKGIMPLEHSFLSIKPSNLILSALKRSEDRNSYILRVFNPTGDKVHGNIAIFAGIKEAYITDLNEDRLESLAVEQEHSITIEVGGNKIVTLEFIT